MKGVVFLGDMRLYQVLGTRNISMEMFDGFSLDLQDVRYVLDMKRNLISLNALDVGGCKISIVKRFIKVYSDDMTLMKAFMNDGLYVIDGHKCFGTVRVVVFKENYSSQ